MNESYYSEPKSRKSHTLEFVKKLMITQYIDVMSTPKILETISCLQHQGKKTIHLFGLYALFQVSSA